MFVNFLSIKNKEYLTGENFVIHTNYLNQRLCRHCKFPNERSFPGSRGDGVGHKTNIKRWYQRFDHNLRRAS